MAPKRGHALITYGKQQPSKKRRTVPFTSLELANGDLTTMSWVPAKHVPEPLVPKRPDSQKAATMAVEPDQDSIATLCAIAGCDPDTARRYLKVSIQASLLAVRMLRVADRRDDVRRSNRTMSNRLSMLCWTTRTLHISSRAPHGTSPLSPPTEKAIRICIP